MVAVSMVWAPRTSSATIAAPSAAQPVAAPIPGSRIDATAAATAAQRLRRSADTPTPLRPADRRHPAAREVVRPPPLAAWTRGGTAPHAAPAAPIIPAEEPGAAARRATLPPAAREAAPPPPLAAWPRGGRAPRAAPAAPIIPAEEPSVARRRATPRA